MSKRRIQKLIQKVVEARKLMRKRYPLPGDTFFEKNDRAYRLLSLVEESNPDKILKIEARKNFIINCVTAIEVFFKDTVVGLGKLGVLKRDNIDAIVERKFTFSEVSQLEDKKINLWEVLSILSSFQSLPEINKIMGALLGINDFLKEMEQYKVKIEGPEEDEKIEFILKEEYPEWRKYLQEIFNLRHRFVHQISFTDKLGKDRIYKLLKNTVAFIIACDEYLLSLIPLNS